VNDMPVPMNDPFDSHPPSLSPSLPPSLQAKQGSRGGIVSFLIKTPLIYILRWIRLTPTYFFVLLMYW